MTKSYPNLTPHPGPLEWTKMDILHTIYPLTRDQHGLSNEPPNPLIVYVVIECPLGEAAAAWSELELLSTLQPLASVAVASVASSEDGKGKAFPTWAWKITLGWGTIKWQKELLRERKVLSRVITRFFMEVGHETTRAFSGNHNFFTLWCHPQT